MFATSTALVLLMDSFDSLSNSKILLSFILDRTKRTVKEWSTNIPSKNPVTIKENYLWAEIFKVLLRRIKRHLQNDEQEFMSSM